MNELRLPHSGRLLICQLAAYGLSAALDRYGLSAWVGHDPHSLELHPIVRTDADAAEVANAIRSSAQECETAVEADIEPGKRGNERIPVIRARATDAARAEVALELREDLLDGLEIHGAELAAGLLAGLGSPAPWLRHEQAQDRPMPGRGATRLDGVAYNIGSDVVRGALRRSLPAALSLDEDEWQRVLKGCAKEGPDRLQWSPPHTLIPLAAQWLAALGLTLLPVGLVASGRARTASFWQDRSAGVRGVALPILRDPVSVPRLRALLQRRELTAHPDPPASERLKALGVEAIAIFAVNDNSSSTMVQFSFAPATLVNL